MNAIKTDIENRPVDTAGGEEGEGEMDGERNTETYNTMCEIDTQWALMTQGAQTGALRQAEGWEWEGDGREGREEGDTGVPVAVSC